MGNIIKIPTLGGSLKTGYSPLIESDSWQAIEGEVNGVSFFTTVPNLATETDGNGGGLILNFTLYEDLDFDLNIPNGTIATGYEVGDTISFTVPAGSPVGNETAFTLETVVTEDMIAFEGDKVQYAPVFNQLGLTLLVIPPPDNLYDYWQVAQVFANHSVAWRINILGGNAGNRVTITNRITEAFSKACQDLNSHPTLELPAGVFCSSVESRYVDIRQEDS